ncbi:hypothetical protein [Flavobacterium sp. N1946]|uniref:hypothetical protein n=1 Tax=Flavobacterium sp. N1946 TaxID=2986826 RepID=UPI002224059F|nr:hypothetical protein [Flavobacterium sp. N1946]
MSEHVFSKVSFFQYGFQDYPLAWCSDDRAWLDFSKEKPVFSINQSVVYVRISESSISGKSDNINKKQEATVEFFRFIILNKLKFYNKSQRKRLLDRYEISIKKMRKIHLSEWFIIMFLYLNYFDSNSLKKVIRRFVKSIKYED